MSQLGLDENEIKSAREEEAEPAASKAGSAFLWIAGVVALGFLGSLVGKPFGALAAYKEDPSRVPFPLQAIIFGLIALGALGAIFYYRRKK